MAISSYAVISARLDITTPAGIGKSVELSEGDFIENLVYVENGEEITLSGVVRVINTTNLSGKIAHTCPPEPYTYRVVRIDSLVIDHSEDCDSNITTVPVQYIVDFGSVTSDFMKKPVDVTTGTAGIADAIAATEEGQEIALVEGSYTGSLTINKGCTIVGPNDVSQNPNMVMDSEAINTRLGAVIAEAMTIDAPDQKVEIRGVTFADNCRITLTNAREVSIQNCRFVNIASTGSGAGEIPIMLNGENPTKVTITGCMFGAKNTSNSNTCKNVLEVYTPLKNGSEISNNYVADETARNNAFCIYEVDDGAVVTIRNNFFENSHNGVRVGTKGNANCTVIIEGNKFPKTGDAPYDGLLLIQPYSSQTESFENVTIRLNRNTGPEDIDHQLYYLYYGGSDTVITEDKMPTVYVDGVLDDVSKHTITG